MAFNDSKKEYTIENMYPKRPLINYLWNEKYIAVINQFGCGRGMTELENHYWHNIFREGDSRLIFIKYEDEVYAVNRNYNNQKFEQFSTTVGQGYSTIKSEYKKIESEFTILVPNEGMRECWELKLTNKAKKDISFDLYAYADVDAQLTEHLSCNISDFNKELNGICVSHKVYASPSKYHLVYFATNEDIYSYETAKRRFFGIYGDTRNPEAIKKECLSSTGNSFDNGTSSVLHIKVQLKKDETKNIYFTAGIEACMEDVIANAQKALKPEYFISEFDYLKKQAAQYDSRIYVETPDEEVNRFANIWLKRQMELGKTWGRVYNKGFRDIMQDISGFTLLDGEISRKKILDCIQYQKEDGNTLRSWVPIDLRPYRDGAVWLISTVVAYIKETGDYTILDEKVPYWKSDVEESVFEHCIRGAEFLHREVGEHGLCLWGGGDWNDSFDGAGVEWKGESVWLSIAAVKSTNDLIDLLHVLGKTEQEKRYTIKRDEMRARINQHGWDKDHYIYGINDVGMKVGSYETEQGQIFLNPQTWAVMSGVCDDPQKLLDFVEKELACDFGYVQQKPSYTVPDEHLGRISYFGKGFYENGSCYNHGTAFKVVADCMAGRADYAYDTLKKILPQNKYNDYTKSGMEPYALCNMFFGPENETRAGEAPMSWITGTSSWVFRAIVEYICGPKAGFEGLVLEPQLPTSWESVKITRAFRDAVYNIEIHRGHEKKCIVDDTIISGNVIPAYGDHKEHKVILYI